VRLSRKFILIAVILLAILGSASCNKIEGQTASPTEPEHGAVSSTNPGATPSAPGSTATAGTRISATVAVHDGNGYTFGVTFDISVAGNLSEDTVNSKPGQAAVMWSSNLAGTFTITNTTVGHTLPIPAWVGYDNISSSCNGNPSHCLSLYGLWPIESPVCSVKMVDSTGYYAFVAIAPTVEYSGYGHVSPPGHWCVLRYGHAGNVSAAGDRLDVAGTASANWESEGIDGVLLNEKDYPTLATALTKGPPVWIASSPTWAGEVTKYDIPNCSVPTIFWTSAPVACSAL